MKRQKKPTIDSACEPTKRYSVLLCGLLFLGGCVQLPTLAPADSDYDGVSDSSDMCPNSAPGTAVNSRGCAFTSVPPGLDERIASESEGLKTFHPGYATNRQFDGTRFGSALAAKTTFGFCEVTIPDHHDPGELERPETRFFFPDELENEQEHIVLQNVSRVSRDEFVGYLEQSTAQDVLLFVHGYNVTFEQAAWRTAQLHHDLRFPGKSMFFSWASDGETLGYVNDATKISHSIEDIADFVSSIASIEDIDNIFMIGHSMGSRGLTRALLSLREELTESERGKLKELILVQPDISQRIFRTRIAPGLRDLGARVTIYASEHDRPLELSQTINRAPRLGQAGSHLYSSSAFDIIDASDVGVKLLELNHSEYAENLNFLDELRRVIGGLESSDRTGLSRRSGHWYLKPEVD